jgi:hypothetical protein
MSLEPYSRSYRCPDREVSPKNAAIHQQLEANVVGVNVNPHEIASRDSVPQFSPGEHYSPDDIVILARVLRKFREAVGQLELRCLSIGSLPGGSLQVRAVGEPRDCYSKLGFAKSGLGKLGQVLQFKGDAGSITYGASYDCFAILDVLNEFPRVHRSDVTAPECRAAIGVIKLGGAVINDRPDFQPIPELPTAAVQGSVSAMNIASFPAGLRIFCEGVVRVLIRNMKADSFEQFGHDRGAQSIVIGCLLTGVIHRVVEIS